MAEKPAVVSIAKEPAAPKPVAVQSLFDQANAVFDAISRRAYEIFRNNGGGFGHELDDWFAAERELLHPVHIQLSESGADFEIKAEVPGFNEKEIEINVEPQRLVISGKRETKSEEKKGKVIHSETCSNQILRIVELPSEVETGKVTAVLKNGILELKLPKTAKARSIRVEPKAAA